MATRPGRTCGRACAGWHVTLGREFLARPDVADVNRVGRASLEWRGCTKSVMHAYVGVTDSDWYRFLAAHPEVAEVNFWQPSGGREFRILGPGEPPSLIPTTHNRVVGAGFVSDSARLRVSEAWELFGEANGVAVVEQTRARIGRYRRTPIGSSEHPVIGCLFVRDVRFFPKTPPSSLLPGSPTAPSRTRAAISPTSRSPVLPGCSCSCCWVWGWNWTSARPDNS